MNNNYHRSSKHATSAFIIGGRIFGQVHFDPSSEPALRQCHETSLTFSDDRADFGQCEEVVSFFIGLFCEEKGPFGFLGALSLSKSPKSQKDPFSNKTYR